MSAGINRQRIFGKSRVGNGSGVRCLGYRRILRELIVSWTGFNIGILILRNFFLRKLRRKRRLCLLRTRRCWWRGHHIAPLPRYAIECDIFDAFAYGRCRQTFGDLCLAGEIAFALRIGSIPKLVRQRVERIVHKLLVSP